MTEWTSTPGASQVSIGSSSTYFLLKSSLYFVMKSVSVHLYLHDEVLYHGRDENLSKHRLRYTEKRPPTTSV